jgi:hypothetical protein
VNNEWEIVWKKVTLVLFSKAVETTSAIHAGIAHYRETAEMLYCSSSYLCCIVIGNCCNNFNFIHCVVRLISKNLLLGTTTTMVSLYCKHCYVSLFNTLVAMVIHTVFEILLQSSLLCVESRELTLGKVLL